MRGDAVGSLVLPGCCWLPCSAVLPLCPATAALLCCRCRHAWLPPLLLVCCAAHTQVQCRKCALTNNILLSCPMAWW